MRRVFSALLCVAILAVPVASVHAGLLLHKDPLAKMTKQPLFKGHKPPPGQDYTGKQPKAHKCGCAGCCGQQ